MSLRTTATLVCVVLAGGWLLKAEPVVALTLFAILAVGILASLKLGGWVRTVTIGGVLIGLFLIFPRSIGERNHDEVNAIGTLKQIAATRQAGAQTPLETDLFGAEPRQGYRFMVHAGQTPLVSFAVVAVPTGARAATRRSFCLDDTGRIYVTPDAAVPRVQDGRCADTSRPIR